VWEGEQLAGMGALKFLDDKHGEQKSMRTAPTYLRRCFPALNLRPLLHVAHKRFLPRLSLETAKQAGLPGCHKHFFYISFF
ncbi:GNAT family N-acetyltransferase, partial [Escherichia coli]|uniref:GNAT family N-acetyltransferase n=1 Tax=Escherichia coli TaxID=562 RepID=UPI0010CC02D2